MVLLTLTVVSVTRAYIEEIGSGLYASLRSWSTAAGEISDFPPVLPTEL